MDVTEIEKRENFDSSLAIDAINRFFTAKVGGPFSELDSASPGVVALEQIGIMEQRKFSWDELAATVARETGYTMLCIADADWSQDDDCDTPATWFSFDIPSVPDDYRSDIYRNKIHPIGPTTAPSEDDFRRRDKAVKFVKAYTLELRARLEYTEDPNERGDIESDVTFLHALGNGVDAGNTDLVEALNAHDLPLARTVYYRDMAADDVKETSSPTL